MRWAAAVVAAGLLTLVPGTAEDPRRREDPDALAAAAASFMSRARVTGDGSLYAKAETACDRALAQRPDHYEALRVRAWVLDGQHRFAEAAVAARRARSIRPSDPFNLGTLGDALVELGDYAGAAAAFQTMLDLRPDAASYARGAYLRELYGDVAGALELMTQAAKAAGPGDESWYRSQLGDLRFAEGDARGAANEQQEALRLAPRSHAALAGLARADAALGLTEQAVTLYTRSLEIFPSPLVAAELGDLLDHLGRREPAARSFALVEAAATLGGFDRQIAVIHADRGIDVMGAWRVAEASLASRRDVYGYDAAAWCALRAGKLERAREAARVALSLGTQDARLFYHAGMIALASGDVAVARRLLSLALGTNPHFGIRDAGIARRTLRELS